MVEGLLPTKVSALRRDFDTFLFARVNELDRGIPLSMVSVLARLDLDPWAEAAVLTLMPAETAIQRLAALLTNLPEGPASGTDAQLTASRLVGLLPGQSGPASGWSASDTEQHVPVIFNFALLVMLSMVISLLASAAIQLGDRSTPARAKAEVAVAAVPPVPARP